MKKIRLFFILSLCFSLIPAYLNAGELQYQASTAVEDGLKTGDLASEFNFYYSGSRAEPHTIIGVARNVPFDQSLWQETDSSAVLLQKWSELIGNPYRHVRDRYFGGYIVDQQGNRLGVWYSKYRFRSAQITGDNLHIGRPFRKDQSRPRRGRIK